MQLSIGASVLITFLQKLQIHVRMNMRVGTIPGELKIHACVKQCVFLIWR